MVLGGGVARGIAHIGVLKVLQEKNVPIDYIVGTSSGSFVAAAFASGMDVALIEQIALRIHWGEFFKFSFFRPGLISSQALEDFVIKYIGDLKISELKIPFAAVGTDIKNGGQVVMSEGKIAAAVAASSAFPGFFAPGEYQGRFIIDGGIAANVPVNVAKQMGAGYIIASDVIPRKSVQAVPRDPGQALGRSLDIIFKKLSSEETKLADVLIELEMEEDIWHLDLHKAKKLITAGEVAAHRHSHEISKALKLRSVSLK